MRKTTKESWVKETLTTILVGIEKDVEVEKKKEFCKVLHVPCVKGVSEGLQRKLRKLNIGVVPKKGEE